MSHPIILASGTREIETYTVQNGEHEVFQISYYEGGHRQRKTFGKVSVAKRGAKLVLNRSALNGYAVAGLSTADIERYVVAKNTQTLRACRCTSAPSFRVGVKLDSR